LGKEFKSNFLTRSITALVISVPIFGIVLFENKILVLLTILVTLFFAFHEWLKNSTSSSFVLNHMALLIFFILLFLAPHKFAELTIFLSGVFWIIFSVFLISNSTSKLYFVNFNNIFIRYLVIISFFLCSIYILEADNIFTFSNYILFLIFILNSAISDSAAYLAGSNFGKNPLFSEISPNKTVEGFVGGILFSTLFGGLIFALFNTTPLIIILMIAGSFYAFVGDYFFSFLKRKSGIKDTGNLLPGHGGILDRIDSHLSSLPILTSILILAF
tara:strand:+ start:3264 stop:4082 length:819 start_codon:yes stop_codon:yes gene_type:complete